MSETLARPSSPASTISVEYVEDTKDADKKPQPAQEVHVVLPQLQTDLEAQQRKPETRRPYLIAALLMVVVFVTILAIVLSAAKHPDHSDAATRPDPENGTSRGADSLAVTPRAMHKRRSSRRGRSGAFIASALI